MYVDEKMVTEALEQFHNGEMDLGELSELISWYDGDFIALL